MAKLSALVKLRNTLDEKLNSIDFSQYVKNVCDVLNLIRTENPEINDTTINEGINKAILAYKELSKTADSINDNLRLTIDYLDSQIAIASAAINEQLYLKDESYELQLKSDLIHPAHVFQLSATANQVITASMLKYADWHYPTLRLGCTYVGQENLTQVDNQIIIDYSKSIEYSNLLVAGDPLYFCDIKQAYIDSVTSHFTEIYSQRIRKYVIKDHDFSQLPQNQFGFIFSWMFFNFRDFITIELYLQNLIKLLRPGGIIMFSYNNTDIYDAAKTSENGMMSSIPKKKLIELVKNIGFEIITHRDIPNEDFYIKNISYIEVKKPGQLQSIKLKQVLGTIGSK